jgi:hypothetical protein
MLFLANNIIGHFRKKQQKLCNGLTHHINIYTIEWPIVTKMD